MLAQQASLPKKEGAQALAVLEIRQIRELLGKSQREFAGLLGVSLRAVQSYEQGWRSVPACVRKLARLTVHLQGDSKRCHDCPVLASLGA